MEAAPFKDDPQLQHRVNQALSDPSQYPLLRDITDYVLRLQSSIASLQTQLHAARQPNASGFAPADAPGPVAIPTHQQRPPHEPPAKKRKLPGDDDSGTASWWKTAPAALTARDVSFSVPMRKKLCLEVVPTSASGEGGLRAVVAPGSSDVEGGLRWSDIEQVMVVPVPEKAQPTTNFVVVPRPELAADALVWTVPGAGAPKNWQLHGQAVEAGYQDALQVVLNTSLQRHGKRVVAPSADEFVSNVVQAHRKGEKNWHVKGWLGSKEGYIYPLPTGLLFGFKKPVLFFALHAIASISYTSVLQRTFNLVVRAAPDPAAPDRDFEFSMLDQADFAPLDAYVKKHGLHDASLAAGRRAQQKRAANGAPPAAAAADDDETELAKAERELQDAEDEEEEDFDPGSEGDSDGSGEDSDEDDGGHDDDDVHE